MKGLLYKDFIANNGRYYAFFIAFQFVLILLLRMTFNNNPGAEVGAVYVFFALVAVFPMLIITILGESLHKKDGTRHVRYIISTPISPKEYVQSKYLYMCILFIIISVIAVVEYIILYTGVNVQNSLKLLKSIGKMTPIIIAICAFVVSIEFPFYFGLGVDKGKVIKEGLIFLLLFAFMGYIFFGDLEIIQNISILKLLEKLVGDKKNLIFVQIGAPVIACICLVLSYFISNKVSVFKNDC